jgi:hypothetical protein
MKHFSPSRGARRGSALLMTLVFTGVTGLVLASYLTLVSAQNRSVVRSQTWNSAIPVVEAGIEEALAHLNQNRTTNVFSQNWRNRNGYAVRKRRLGDCIYIVAINPLTQPVIECTGYVPAPLMFSDTSSFIFGQVGTLGHDHTTYIYRTVRAITKGGPLFARGMVAKGSINMNGNGVSSDSFDSADPNYSTNGRYDRTKQKDNGDVATDASGNVFDAGNANIMGHVATGPGGNVSVGANGTVGSKGWVLAGNGGIEPGHFSDDMNMDFPEVKVPFSGGMSPRYNASVSVTNISYGSGLVTTPTLPSPLPAGGITTNYGTYTSDTMPSPVPAGGVTASLVVRTSTEYPTNATVGPVTTNSAMVVNTPTLPNPLPSNLVRILTNSVTLTNTTLPSPTPAFVLRTNVAAVTVPYPNSPMPAKTADPGPWTPPNPGTYVGDVTRYYQNGNPKGWYQDYQAIQSYVYQTRDYTVVLSSGYQYTNWQYTYTVPQTYTYTVNTSTNITITTQTYDMVFDSGNYQVASLGGKVYVGGSANVLVTGDISFTGQGGITIGPRGSLNLYMEGASTKIAGNGVVNMNGSAFSFMYYGRPSNTSLDIQGNGQFTGTIYAPNADFKLGGGGNDTQDFIGASVTASVFMNGHFNFHYDEDLARRGPQNLYVVTDWQELGPNQATMLTDPQFGFSTWWNN